MAEKKTKTITHVDAKEPRHVEASKSDVGFRVGGIVCWVLAIAAEMVAILIAFGKINWTFTSTLAQLIGLIVIDLVFLIVGSQLWKRANHINPASEKNKVAFFVQNNLGSFMSILCFLPLVIVILFSKNEKIDKKTKTWAVVAAVVALLVGGVASYDFNPVSQEQKDAAQAAITQEVYWTRYGKVYHINPECQALNRSDELLTGGVDAAIENGKTRLCKFCAKEHNIEGVVTDGE